MKLLIIDLERPDESRYMNPDKVDCFFWGRYVDKYPMFAVADDGAMTPIIVTSADIHVIKQQVRVQFEKCHSLIPTG